MKQKRIFKGRLLNLYTRRETLPTGYVADLEVVEHPGAVLIIPFLDRERIILIRQYRPVIRSYIWELPAGTLDKGEKPPACARRELVEEIGYRASSWSRLGYIYPAPGYTTEKIHIFSAKGLLKVPSRREEDEVIEPRIFTRREIAGLMKSGRIVDAKTVCALAMAGVAFRRA